MNINRRNFSKAKAAMVSWDFLHFLLFLHLTIRQWPILQLICFSKFHLLNGLCTGHYLPAS
jgi:hypothetical protein